MKKFLCTSLLAAALIVQPVSGSDASIATTDLRMTASGSSVWDHVRSWIPDQVERMFDEVRAYQKPARSARAANARSTVESTAPTRLAATAPMRTNLQGEVVTDATGKAANPEQQTHWPVLLGALLLMGMIVRRRTAVK
jgi:hypothetical protein